MKKIISGLLILAVLLITALPCSAEAGAPQITLQIKDFNTREVLSFSYEFSRPIDIEGELAGIPRAKTFVIRVAGLKDGNNDLLSWALAGVLEPKDVSVNFEDSLTGQTMKAIKLTDAYCSRYTEYWNIDGTYYEEIEIVSRRFENGPANYENPWN